MATYWYSKLNTTLKIPHASGPRPGEIIIKNIIIIMIILILIIGALSIFGINRVNLDLIMGGRRS